MREIIYKLMQLGFIEEPACDDGLAFSIDTDFGDHFEFEIAASSQEKFISAFTDMVSNFDLTDFANYYNIENMENINNEAFVELKVKLEEAVKILS